MFVFWVPERARVVVISCLECAFCKSNVGFFMLVICSAVAKPGSCVWSCKTFASAEGASHLGGSGGILPRKIFEISTPKIAIFSNLSIKF